MFSLLRARLGAISVLEAQVFPPPRTFWRYFRARGQPQKNAKKICTVPKSYYLCNPKQHGAVAQMVEQWTENPCVGSSILPSTTENAPTDTCGGISLPKCAYIL